MSSLARLSLLKSKLLTGITDTSWDAILKEALKAATKRAQSEVGRALIQATYTDERYTGSDTNLLYPEHFPVTALSAVSFWDGDAWTAETLSYFEVIDGLEVVYPMLGEESNADYSVWPATYDRGIKLTYTAGYDNTGWDEQSITITVDSLTTAPAVGDVLTQANTGGTITVTSASIATNTITGTLGGTGLINTSDNITSDDAGATMAPTPIVPTDISFGITTPSGFDVPEDLEYAIAKLAALSLKDGTHEGAGRLGLNAIGFGEVSLKLDRGKDGLPDEIKWVFLNYARVIL